MELKTYRWDKNEDETYNLYDVEILETFSTQKRGTIEEEDLDKIVENFNSIKETRSLIPRLFLGHRDADPYRIDAGFVGALKRVGKMLYANFIKVPEKIFQKFSSNDSLPTLPYRSVEIDRERMRLLGVALLATEFPYCDLPMTAVKLSSSSFLEGDVIKFSMANNQNSLRGGLANMPEEITKKEKEELEKKVEVPEDVEEVSPSPEEEMEEEEQDFSSDDPMMSLLKSIDEKLSKLIGGGGSEEKYTAKESKEKAEENKPKGATPNSVATSKEEYSSRSSSIHDQVMALASMDPLKDEVMRKFRQCFSAKDEQDFLEDYKERLKYTMPFQHEVSTFSATAYTAEETEEQKIFSSFNKKDHPLVKQALRNWRDTVSQRDKVAAKDFVEKFSNREDKTPLLNWVETYVFMETTQPGYFEKGV